MKKPHKCGKHFGARAGSFTLESSRTDMHSLADLRIRAITPSHAHSISVTSHENEGSSRCKRTTAPTASGRAAEVPRGEAPGLVPSQTSDTPTPTPSARPDRFQIIPSLNRLKRLKTSVLTAARLHVQSKSKWRVVMITPTYAPGQYWESKDITGLVKCIRQWLSRKNIEMRYVWVMEYTRKGAPHYHMLVWLPLGTTLPYPDKRGWWTKGWTNQEWARNAIGYIAKYASKGSDLIQYVRGARHHGNGGMDGDALLEQRWWKLPSWLRGGVEPSDRVRKAPSGTGGGYINPGTGQCFVSPYEVFFENGQIFVQLKAVWNA